MRWEMFVERVFEAVKDGREVDQQAFDAEVREFELGFGNSVEPLPAARPADTYELCRKLAR